MDHSVPTFRLLCGLAVLFLLLGVGNILLANQRIERYSQLLRSAELEQASVIAQTEGISSLFQGLNENKQERYIELLAARLDFYVFCAHGGNILLALSAMLFSAALLVRRLPIGARGPEEQQLEEQNDTDERTSIPAKS